MKICVVLNPSAGSAVEASIIAEKLSALDPEIRRTRGPGDAMRIAQHAVADGCELVVAAGGDGTLNEVVNGLGEESGAVRLGLIPLGTGNDFARTLGLPTGMDEAIECLVSGRPRLLDLVKVTSDRVRYFLNVSAGGFSGLVNEKLTAEVKQLWGPLAYLRSAAAALPDLEAYQATLVLDDVQEISERVYNVIVGNGRYVAGGIPVAPEAVPDDGLLDLILLKEMPAPELTLTVAQILLGQHLNDPGIVFRRAGKIAVTSEPGMWFNVDGELVGNEPAVFEVLPKAVSFMVSGDDREDP